MILSKLKVYGLAIAGVALTVLLTAVKILTWKNSQLRERVQVADAKVRVARVVAKQDIQIDQQTDSHRADLINEIEDTGDSTGFRTPAKWWDEPDD